ncbi:MAG: hypothetical protein MZU97_08675 [Bacillus subtilis]|nr:hypothetical protein [Bacillus subtilis]
MQTIASDIFPHTYRDPFDVYLALFGKTPTRYEGDFEYLFRDLSSNARPEHDRPRDEDDPCRPKPGRAVGRPRHSLCPLRCDDAARKKARSTWWWTTAISTLSCKDVLAVRDHRRPRSSRSSPCPNAAATAPSSTAPSGFPPSTT